ncbi:ImmA/IrrE family metallo-endopeptidase [Pseudomonas sp. PDM16]|uniref:XRE family transcriptional regulator n=1 Tax=Pseudomonas sp. PDM16 TaxID=2769292 RepID=UPI0017838180|nr:XRE family transcriptional regulator [Pseudomonas sp. PDM16]MBD9415257.1 ImmA/IrrE family metallo-endopeptidase [Pseudomonas sp. PDM16]
MHNLIKHRLHYLREAHHFTQEELAQKLGFKDRQTLSQIENGERKLSSSELVLAAHIFSVELDFFTDPFELAGEGRFSWRQSGTPPEILDAFELKAGRWIATYRHLSKLKGKAINSSIRRLALDRRSSFEEAVEEGEAIGRLLGLGEVPSERLAESLQKELDTLVLEVDTAPGISGAACQLTQMNAIVVNRNEPQSRRNYDLAHELFHLMTWSTMPPPRFDDIVPARENKRVEQLAENFAAGLLMPGDVMERYIQEAGGLPRGGELVSWLNTTAQRLGVSAVALQWRLVNIKAISMKDRVADELLRHNGSSPKDAVPPKFGKQFMEVIGWAIDNGQVSVRRAAKLLDITVDELSTIFEGNGLRVPYDL